MTTRVLCVDDEPNILLAFARQLRKFEIVTALGPELGIKTIEQQGPFAVVVSDLRMPRMNGVQFLAKVKEMSPDTVRIMLTGEGDLASASEAVNQGNVFRFLLKPCETEVLSAAISAGLEQYRLQHAEKNLLEQTLRGSVEVMAEILGLANREAFGQSHRMRRYVRHISASLHLPDSWQYEVAALLSQIGCIAVPPEILNKVALSDPLSDSESAVYAARWQVAHDLLAKIPRLDGIAKIIRSQGQTATGQAMATGDAADVGSRILQVAIGLDELVAKGMPLPMAVAKLKTNKAYDAAMTSALETMAEGDGAMESRSVRIAELRPGMILNSDVRSRSGVLLLGRGQEITPSVIARLKGFAKSATGVVEPLSVAFRVPVVDNQPLRLSDKS